MQVPWPTLQRATNIIWCSSNEFTFQNESSFYWFFYWSQGLQKILVSPSSYQLSFDFDFNWGRVMAMTFKLQHSTFQPDRCQQDHLRMNQELIPNLNLERFEAKFLHTTVLVPVIWNSWIRTAETEPPIKTHSNEFWSRQIWIHLKFMESKLWIGLIRSSNYAKAGPECWLCLRWSQHSGFQQRWNSWCCQKGNDQVAKKVTRIMMMMLVAETNCWGWWWRWCCKKKWRSWWWWSCQKSDKIKQVEK